MSARSRAEEAIEAAVALAAREARAAQTAEAARAVRAANLNERWTLACMAFFIVGGFLLEFLMLSLTLSH